MVMVITMIMMTMTVVVRRRISYKCLEDGVRRLLRNIGGNTLHCTMQNPRRP